MPEQRPPCPVCKSPRHVVVGAGKPGERYYRCQKCGGMFDDDASEGGDYDDRDASRRIQREEERRQRRKRA